MKKKFIVLLISICVVSVLSGILYFSLTKSKEIIYMDSSDMQYNQLIDNLEITDWNQYTLEIDDKTIEPIILGLIRDNQKNIEGLEDTTITGISLNENSIIVQAVYQKKWIIIPVRVFINADAANNKIHLRTTKVKLGIIPIQWKKIIEKAEFTIDLSQQELPVAINSLDITNDYLKAGLTLNNDYASKTLYDFLKENVSEISSSTKLSDINNQTLKIDSLIVEENVNKYLNEYLNNNSEEGMFKIESAYFHTENNTIKLVLNALGIKILVPVECNIYISDNILHVSVVRITSVNELASNIVKQFISEFTLDLNTIGVPDWITVNSLVINPDITEVVYSIDADRMYNSNSSEAFTVIGYKKGDIIPFSIPLNEFNSYLQTECEKISEESKELQSVTIKIDDNNISSNILIAYPNVEINIEIPYQISAHKSKIYLLGKTPTQFSINGHTVPKNDIEEIFNEDITINFDVGSTIPRNLFDISALSINSETVEIDLIIN